MSAHLFIVHFPVAVILIGALADLAGLGLADRALRYRGGQLLIIGGFAAFLAFVTGEGAKIIALNAPAIDVGRIAAHEQWGSVGTWVLLGIAIVRTMWRNRLDGPMGWLNLVLAAGATVLVIGITLSGTMVRHGLQ